MAIQIKTAAFDQYLEGGDKYRILLFGTPGTGKTPFAAQAPDPIFLLADRGGAASLAITGTPYIEIHSEAAANEALDYLAMESLRPSFPYKTVVVDTFSVLQAHVANGIMKRDGLKSMDGFSAWGDLKASMATILNKVQRLNTHVIVNVHLKDKFESDEFEPDLVGSTKIDLPKEFPFIGWIHPEWASDTTGGRKVVRKISWRSTPKFPILRSPAGLLDETTVEFKPTDFQQIEDALTGQAAKYGKASTQNVGEAKGDPNVAAPDIKGGAVTPKADQVPGTRKKAAAKPAKAAVVEQAEKAQPEKAEPETTEQPEPTHDEAVETVQEVLGGEVLADKVQTYDERIEETNSIDDLKRLFLDNKDKPDWTDQHTKAVTVRKRQLAAA